MAKFKLKKKSKRQPARLRYKIEKKIRDHNRNQKKEAKKHPKKKKQKLIQIPNICPFKEDILKEVNEYKKAKKLEQQLAREARLPNETKTNSMEELVLDAQNRGNNYDASQSMDVDSNSNHDKKQENSLKTFYKEFKKVVDKADVVLEILDARDPLGTRCLQVEELVRETGNKRIVLVLNKADLVPREILNKWLRYLRRFYPTVAFKASTQMQNNKLGRRKMFSSNNQSIQNSVCVGAELVTSLLANYCRNKEIKTAITVGVVGMPNVGKSSIINSLKRSKACNVGATPGVTKQAQEIHLDSKIKLLDSPGIVFASPNGENDTCSALKNVVRVENVSDPFEVANVILQRATKEHLMQLYDIVEYSSPEEFYHMKAKRMGRFKKGGVPDTAAAARGLIDDWNRGKIKYHTLPPEDENSEIHLGASIVSELSKEFDIENFESLETETLNMMETSDNENAVIFNS